MSTICNICKRELPIDSFGLRKDDIRYKSCIKCHNRHKEYYSKYQVKKKEQSKYYTDNKDLYNDRSKSYYEINKQQLREKANEKLHCTYCNKDISRSNWKRHELSATHVRNS